MAYSFTAASSQYLSTASAPVTAPEYTLATLGRSSTTNAVRSLIVIGSTTQAQSNQITLGSSGKARAASTVTNSSFAEATASYSADTWYSIAGVFASTASRTIYFEGGNSATETTNRDTNAINVGSIGAGIRANVAIDFMDGRIAEAAIWNVALTDAEIASLAKGFKPQRIRPQSLVFYAPLIRNLMDRRRGLTITNNNSATVADHPRVY